MDYLIADKTVIPLSSQSHYFEKIAYLPHSYQANDDQRIISEKIFTRSELGLPEKGIIYCCFNNNYKITPQVFDSWMTILNKVENSVLWCLAHNPLAQENLRKEAHQRGIMAERILFAGYINLPEHLARHQCADLFLDTYPYNAHTTASDALWAGLLVLTRSGNSFPSRVSASLLSSIGLPEMITHTPDEYEALAIDLGNHPDKILALKQKLARNRLKMPLFNTALFTKHLEAAYIEMYQRYQAALPPDNITVSQ
jgi:predicted O-linked N-acetylglucosamine transferase (SPINDLY family)